MNDPKGLFDRWHGAPLRMLETLSNGDGAFVTLAVSMSRTTVQNAEERILAGSYDEAASILRSIIDSNVASEVKADALVWLGTLSRMWPAVSPTDQSGHSSYVQALALVPDHLWAMVGVIDSFGEHVPDHQDAVLVRQLIPKLRQRASELDESVLATINKKAALILERARE